MTTRRSFITSLISFVAAPAIVRAGSLMPVKSMPPLEDLLNLRTNAAYAAMRDNMNKNLYGDLVSVARWGGYDGTYTTRKVQIG